MSRLGRAPNFGAHLVSFLSSSIPAKRKEEQHEYIIDSPYLELDGGLVFKGYSLGEKGGCG